jgi:hypothetical protein
MAESKEKSNQSSNKSEALYYLTIYILPGDGTPRILPTSVELIKESYDELEIMMNCGDPIPDQFRYKTPEGQNWEHFNFRCERILSVTVDKIEAQSESGIILTNTTQDSRRIIQ